MTTRKFDLAIAIALVPILGTGLVLMNQLGRFFYYGVPPEMLEMDAYKVLTSTLSMIFIGTALLYAGATLYDSTGSRVWERMVFHLCFAAMLTAPFWFEDLDWNRSVSWAAVAFVVFTGLVMFGAERWLRREAGAEPRERLSGWALIAFFASVLVLAATCTHGYLAERDRTSYTFVGTSNDAVVGRLGNMLILKTYDVERRTFVREHTKLLSVQDSLVLETRTVPRH